VPPLVGVMLSKRILRKLKLDWFANEQHVHKMFDFLI
jgi:hypothetical protein